MRVPQDLLYTRDHEWIRVEGAKGFIGISDYAQHQLGDIVYIEMPEADGEVSLGEEFGIIESVKAVANLFAPVSGLITEVNEELEEAPELLNQDPYENWIITVELRDPDELAELPELMNAKDYAAYCAALED